MISNMFIVYVHIYMQYIAATGEKYFQMQILHLSAASEIHYHIVYRTTISKKEQLYRQVYLKVKDIQRCSKHYYQLKKLLSLSCQNTSFTFHHKIQLSFI